MEEKENKMRTNDSWKISKRKKRGAGAENKVVTSFAGTLLIFLINASRSLPFFFGRSSSFNAPGNPPPPDYLILEMTLY